LTQYVFGVNEKEEKGKTTDNFGYSLIAGAFFEHFPMVVYYPVGAQRRQIGEITVISKK